MHLNGLVVLFIHSNQLLKWQLLGASILRIQHVACMMRFLKSLRLMMNAAYRSSILSHNWLYVNGWNQSQRRVGILCNNNTADYLLVTQNNRLWGSIFKSQNSDLLRCPSLRKCLQQIWWRISGRNWPVSSAWTISPAQWPPSVGTAFVWCVSWEAGRNITPLCHVLSAGGPWRSRISSPMSVWGGWLASASSSGPRCCTVKATRAAMRGCWLPLGCCLTRSWGATTSQPKAME